LEISIIIFYYIFCYFSLACTDAHVHDVHIVLPFAGLGGGISWWPPAYSLLKLKTETTSHAVVPASLPSIF